MIIDGCKRGCRVPRATLPIGVALVTAGLAGIGCQSSSGGRPEPAKEPAAQVAPAQSPVERGRYLVSIGGCNDCHTPLKMGANGPEPDMTLELSGHPETLKMPPPPKLPEGPWQWIGAGTNTAFAGPWGVSFSANLTPDQNTGLGIWTEELFMKALRTGKHFGTARPIMPPMPWTYYAQMSDDDLKGIFVYLRTVRPLKNHVPDYIPPPASH